MSSCCRWSDIEPGIHTNPQNNIQACTPILDKLLENYESFEGFFQTMHRVQSPMTEAEKRKEAHVHGKKMHFKLSQILTVN